MKMNAFEGATGDEKKAKLDTYLQDLYKKRRQQALDMQDESYVNPGELEEASRLRGLQEGMSKAADKFSQASGPGLDLSAFEQADQNKAKSYQSALQMEESANQGMLGLADREMDQARQEVDWANQQNLADPNSEESAYARRFAKEAFGFDVPENMTAAQLNRFTPLMEKKWSKEESEKNRAAAAAERAADRDESRKTRESNEKLNRTIKERDTLQRQYNNDIEVKKNKEVMNSYSQSTAIDDTPSGDVALIFQYMKALDPGSVVRETEFETAQAIGNLNQKAQAKFSQMVGTGNRLTPEQRKQLRQQMENLARQSESRIRQYDAQYTKIGRAHV